MATKLVVLQSCGVALEVEPCSDSFLVSSDIQKDIIKCFADEFLHSILEDIAKDVFCLLVDESIDVS